MSVWVVAASKHESTRGVAGVIADELVAAGHDVELRDAREVDSLAAADAVVLGSAIYAGRWLKPARELLEGRSSELAERPTWLFSVGPLGDPPEPEDPEPTAIGEAAAAIGARGHVVSPGKLDRAALSGPERLVARAVHAPEGDFRDWGAVRTWARVIAAEV